MDKKTVLSCIQPTGDMHLGNYFGAVQNWVNLQKDYECIYGVVDYHAMTMPYDVAKLRNNTWELITNLMAVGVKAENLFVQSLVPEHTELGWIFNCFCSYGQLTRMTQFKDKSSQISESSKEEFISVGLLDYPVLQSADILIYKADYVPVGKDQEQHLELTRDIAQRFNNQAGKEYFVLPEGLYTATPKIKSTADPSKKMSKSAGEKHYISLFAEPERITKQIKSAVTDLGEVTDGKMSEGVENLFEMMKAAGAMDAYNALQQDYANGSLKYVDLKEATAKALLDMTAIFRAEKAALNADKKAIKEAVKASSEVIRKKAQQTLKEVKELIGLLNVRY
ncbi:MAG: tryptophan--tRNA ligase [Saprospiraceae bacterium]|nr:tryptophan--tRNA ligase [Saprospiraceae bacterium]MBP7642925.1 tryptophan--tRNA ligase [Saprospiraceae bacterium]